MKDRCVVRFHWSSVTFYCLRKFPLCSAIRLWQKKSGRHIKQTSPLDFYCTLWSSPTLPDSVAAGGSD
ncbi:hypothetical protein QQF64_002294 [Cirrhinus molitorella]|uniref:Uncharacterized protein n=1 Tax=Cirrhinus molitorella TaxID=172907 RepID=A0ABR3MPS2_9TELE